MPDSSLYVGKPGLHSHNVARRTDVPGPPDSKPVSWLRMIFLLIGLSCLGYYAYTLADQKIYQVYENWAFDQQIAGRSAVTFRDYLREQTPFGFLAGEEVVSSVAVPSSPPLSVAAPVEGSVLGRVAIGRLNLSAVVRQGVGDKTLSEAVGHVPSSAFAGEAGNFAIAAHRDTLFRALKDIQKGDLITFQSQTGLFSYRVVATKIVHPTDVSVLRPDGGGLIKQQAGTPPARIMTMITCYPFYYVGSAPRRFIVQAEAIPGRSPAEKPML